MKQIEKKKQDWEEAMNIIILGLKVIRPGLTDEQAKNVIVNVGNHIQLDKINKLKNK